MPQCSAVPDSPAARRQVNTQSGAHPSEAVSRIRRGQFVLPIAGRGVKVQERVDETESRHRRKNGQQAKKAPPAQTVITEQQQDKAADKPHRTIIGSDIFFHRESWFVPTVRLLRPGGSAVFAKT